MGGVFDVPPNLRAVMARSASVDPLGLLGLGPNPVSMEAVRAAAGQATYDARMTQKAVDFARWEAANAPAPEPVQDASPAVEAPAPAPTLSAWEIGNAARTDAARTAQSNFDALFGRAPAPERAPPTRMPVPGATNAPAATDDAAWWAGLVRR